MSAPRRRTRQRADARNPVEAAWDSGLPPPPEAFQHEHRDTLIGCVFFRWAERRPQWVGEHHPHLRDWLAVLRRPA